MLELCTGTLTQFCEKKKCETERKTYAGPELPELPPDVLVLCQIAVGLDFIHSRNLVHRDVKPDNILISATRPVQMKLSDFGFSKKVSPQGTFSQSGLKGTLNWMAPEMLQIMDDKPNELPRGSTQSDTFAAGCVFFYFTTRGSHPFGNQIYAVPANICSNNPEDLHNYTKSMFCLYYILSRRMRILFSCWFQS